MKIKILQWNVWFKENPRNTVRQIQQLKPDVVCLQELIKYLPQNIDTAKFITKHLKYNLFYQSAETWDKKENVEAQGNAILSSCPIARKFYSYVQQPKHNPPDASHEGRVYLEIDIKKGSKVITIATTHLSYSPRLVINNQRKNEVDNLINIIKKNKRNFVLAADLNSTPDSYTVKNILKYLNNAGPDFSQNTWTTKPFEKPGFKEDKVNWRPDYIFVSQDIKVINARIIKTKFSDHLPILVEIEI